MTHDNLKTIKHLMLASLLTAFFVQPLHAQTYKYHSLFIYNFTKYIQWPASYQSGDFVIGVLGNSPINDFLYDMVSNKSVGGQKFVIKKFNSPEEVGKCHMLYIPSSKSRHFDDIMASMAGKSTLIITEKPGLGSKGSAINFIIQDGKVKFELNRATTEKFGLKVSNELAKLAIEV